MRIGVIGSGMISDIYLKNMIDRFDNLEVLAIASKHLENARKKAGKYGLEAMTLQKMLDDARVEAVVNLTPPTVHKQIIEQALAAGKHVYTEKVVALSHQDAAQLQQLAEAKGRRLCSAPDTFLGASVQAALRLIRQGTLGTITGFHAHVDRQMEYYYQFLDYTREPGGGIGYDLGIYYLTVLLSILGPVASVTGMIKTSRPVRAYTKEDSDRFGQNYEIQNENLMVATVQMQSGVLGTLHFNGDAVMPESSTLLLEGTRGILYLGNPDRFGDNLRIFEAGENDQEPAELTREIPVSGAYACNSRGLGVSEMADAIEKGRRPRTDCAMSVHALEVFDGITQSSQTGKSVQMRTSYEVPEPFEAE